MNLIKDNALNDLYGKTLDTFGLKFATMMNETVGSTVGICFSEAFGQRYVRKAISAPLIDRCLPGRTVSRESNIHSGTFHNAEQFPIVVSFTAFYGMIKNIYNVLSVSCLHHAHIRGMTVGHVSFR